MDDLVLARAIHVIAVLFWIGGVGFVTWVVMPALRAGERPADRLARFHQIEGRFAWQARIWVALAGASGLWLIYRAEWPLPARHQQLVTFLHQQLAQRR